MFFRGANADLTNYVPERREILSQYEFGIFVFPILTQLPGIGSAYGAGATARNLYGTKTNLLGAMTFGDLQLKTVAANEIELIKDELFFGIYLYDAVVPLRVFDRGPNSRENDYFFDDQKAYGGAINLQYQIWERRIQLRGQAGASRLARKVRSQNGTPFRNLDQGEHASINHALRLRLDFTDHYVDPRKGIRLDLNRAETADFDGNHSRFYTLGVSLTAFLPIARANTLALHFMRSGAHVYDRNSVSDAELRPRLSLSCGATNAECTATEDARVKERIAENRYGTAQRLGGADTLRGFPSGRISGSQSIFYGSEFRWNLTDENTPFDFFIMRGVRSLIQVALFLEAGAASDPPQSVIDAPLRVDYGIGLRYGFSGTFVRADLGHGTEGSQFTFLLGYPWEPTFF